MLSINLRHSILDFFAKSEDFAPLLDLVTHVANHYDGSVPFILGQANGGDKLIQQANNLQSRFVSLYQITRNIAPRNAYKSLEAFNKAIENSFDESLQNHPFLTNLKQSVEAFVNHYDLFLTDQSPSNAAALMYEASLLNRKIQYSFDALNFFSSAVEVSTSCDDSIQPLSLILFEVNSFREFVDKLGAFQSVYSELCMLLDVSESNNPIRIWKIESGSLWVKVFGETKVIQLFVALIESTVGYLYRRFTTEGKIASIPRKLEALDQAIQISDKLMALGVDTTEMNEHLRKSGVIISRKLSILVQDQPHICINDRQYSVDISQKPDFIAQRRTIFLSDNGERIEPTFRDEEINE